MALQLSAAREELPPHLMQRERNELKVFESPAEMLCLSDNALGSLVPDLSDSSSLVGSLASQLGAVASPTYSR